MSTPVTGSDRPPLPVLTHVALPVALTCLVLAMYPPVPARAATLLLLGVVYIYDASMYGGEDAQSAYWMGCALGPSWCGFVDMFLLARPVREWRFRTLDRPLGELPLLRRTYYVFCASQATRGVGWSYQVSSCCNSGHGGRAECFVRSTVSHPSRTLRAPNSSGADSSASRGMPSLRTSAGRT